MKQTAICTVLYFITAILIFGGFTIAENIYASLLRTYSGLPELYAFLALWCGLTFLLLLLRSRLSVSMPAKAIAISSCISLAVSIAAAILSFYASLMSMHFGNIFYLLILLTLLQDLFDIIGCAIHKPEQPDNFD